MLLLLLLFSVRESYGLTDPLELFSFFFAPASLTRWAVEARLNLEVKVSLKLFSLSLNLDEKASRAREWKVWNSRGRTGKQLIMIPKVISACDQKPRRTTLCVASAELTNLKV